MRSVSGYADTYGADADLLYSGVQQDAGTDLHGDSCGVDIIDEQDGRYVGKETLPGRVDGESVLQIIQPRLGAERLLGRRVRGTQEQIAAAGNAEENRQVPGEKFRLIIAPLSPFVPVDGNRNQKIWLPAQDIRAMTDGNLTGKKLGEHPPVVVFESGHGRAGLFIIDKKRQTAAKTLGKDAAVITIFLAGGRDGLSAGQADGLLHKRKFRGTFAADKVSVWEQDAADRAVPWIEKREDPVIKMKM